jgi:heat-inducible transcriptional repressor
MDFSDRKKKILCAIIKDYIDTAEPIGSKTISQSYNFGLSSATIRNEMAELEEMGLLEQPHTSAGRVPTQLGYRLFVNTMMEQYKISAREMQNINSMMSNRVSELEQLIEDAGKQISEMMRMPTIAITPKLRGNQIKRFEFISVDNCSFVLVIVTSRGIIKNKVFRSNVPFSREVLSLVGQIINRRFCNLCVEEITLPLILTVQDELSAYDFVLPPILRFVADAIQEIDTAEVFLEGAANFLEQPEYQNTERLKNLLTVLGDKDEVKRMLAVREDDTEKPIKIIIGEENPHIKMQNSSIIIGNYKIGDRTVGAIGVIGPTRMDYSKVSAQLEYFTTSLNRLLSEMFEDPDYKE